MNWKSGRATTTSDRRAGPSRDGLRFSEILLGMTGLFSAVSDFEHRGRHSNSLAHSPSPAAEAAPARPAELPGQGSGPRPGQREEGEEAAEGRAPPRPPVDCIAAGGQGSGAGV